MTPQAGDRVDIAPHREGVYGVRVGVVKAMAREGTALVIVAGERWRWVVRFEFLTVVYRP